MVALSNLGHEALSNMYVTFDLWQTLIMDTAEADTKRSEMRCDGIRRVLSDAGISISAIDLKHAYDQSARKFQETWMTNREIQTNEQLRIIIQLLSKANLHLNPGMMKELQRTYVDPFFVFPPQLNRDAKPTLEKISARVKNIGLISNTGRIPADALRRFMREQGILRFFSATFFSDEVGHRKPDVHIFRRAAEQFGADISRGIHVGDNPETDVWGAKNAGMLAVQFIYELPEGFESLPNSTVSLSRARSMPDSEIHPDYQIYALSELVTVIDSLVS